jgi:hypothetical protein
MINYNRKLKIASLNTQGNKLDEVVYFMDQTKIDIMALQDIKISLNTTFSIGNYTIITATSMKDAPKPKQPTLFKNKNKGKSKGKPSTKGKGRGTEEEAEYGGVLCV